MLLEPSTNHPIEYISSEASTIKSFVIKTGYKDEPDRDEDGVPLLQRTTLVHIASKRGCSADSIQSLFKQIYRYDINYVSNDDGASHFHVACASGLLEDARLFLEACDETDRPALLELMDEEGNTPLIVALKNRQLKLAEFLLQNGAGPNVANDEGLTPMHIVCKKNELPSPRRRSGTRRSRPRGRLAEKVPRHL
ncbi:unnamed protein product [Trichogramma brassicae]|uniref:Uncharacterized protein n=1 Tax=Trichogramma brassicae TaxID=86971 RepID=A0A6H5II14_9HYME|nr:unnamed protein product [Trichogramma brassicae]